MKKLRTQFGFDRMLFIVPSLNFAAIQSPSQWPPPHGRVFRFLEQEGRNSLHPHPTRSQQVATLPCKDPTRGPERNVPAPPSARGAEKKTRRILKPVEFRLGTFRHEIFIKEHVHVGTGPKFREGRAPARPCPYQSSHPSTHLRRGARFSPLYSRLGSFGVGLKKLSRKYRIRSMANIP